MPTQSRSHAVRYLLTAAITSAGALLTSGCAAGGGGAGGHTTADPLAVMRDTRANISRRIDAVDEAWNAAEHGSADRAATREALKTILWQSGQPTPLRRRALDRLLDDTSPEGVADTRKVLRLRLPTENDWEILGAICDAAAKRGWVELTPALVRSYARAVPRTSDTERPERTALLALHPGQDIVDIVYAVFSTNATGAGAAPAGAPAIDLDDRTRRDAWVLLSRLDPDGARRAALLAADAGASDDPVVAHLRAAARQLHAVPVTAAEFDWLQSLQNPKEPRNAEWWSAATVAVARLSGPQLDGFALRHAEPVRWAAAHRSEWLTADRQALLDELAARLKGRRLFERTTEVGGNMGRPSGRLVEAAPKLVWGDLLAILVVDEALKDRALVASIFEQVAVDRRDTSTEYGGLLDAADTFAGPASAAAFVATLYPPRPVQRVADNRFVASDEMIESGPQSLAHYHFHAQQARNTEYAGPGDGDLEYAGSQGRSCLVFTSIDDGTLNVDYYQRNGAIVDLGVITR